MADKATLNPALRDFWLTPARVRVLYGGRASSKSWDAAGFAIYLADNYRLRILCARQFQNKISESVYTLLKIQIERFGLQHRFEIQRDRIINRYTGTEFLFYGLWRHIDEVKSLEGIDICWLEEAHNITQEQWEILEPTIRKDHSQFWIIFNPRLVTDFVYRRFVTRPPANAITRKINYTDNPFLSNTMLEVIQHAKEEDEEEYRHIYLGEPREDDDAVIIKRSWIMAAIDAHKKLGIEPSGTKRLGFDVADSGADKCATTLAHGIVAQDIDEWAGREDELLKSCSRVYRAAVKHDAQVIYDSIGVGASVGAKLGELNDEHLTRISYSKFNAGAAVWHPDARYSDGVLNKDMFSNLKAQAWWLVADRFRNTYNAIQRGMPFEEDELISISSECSNLDRLIDELSTPRRDFDRSGKVKVESKQDLAKRDIPSPNLADCFVMAYTPTVEQDVAVSDDALLEAFSLDI
ncbi:PBSX family phage terminase large subunit [Zymobacter sp. IVIA_12111.31 C1]|uniref:PBSX family phage terminase large subunit n=1 Tax=Zymobacter sp. IVIA_12111.31 C1 TaxID=3394854 RepID=UPI0039C05378